MKLIDRYIYAVTDSLPEEIREDVGKELRTNIEDMLPENPTDQDVYRVLEELGNPWKMAVEYNPNKRYLIGPGFYNTYISVLKMVIGICIAVFSGIALFASIVDAPNGHQLDNLTALITDLISAIFEGALQGAFWVTLVFIIIERSGVDAGSLPFLKKDWTPDDLPTLPVHSKKRISRGETVFSMFCTILFTAIIYFQPKLISLYVEGEDGIVNATPLFDIDRLQSYLLIIFCMAIIQLGIFIWKYISGSWNIPLAVANAVYNIASCILLIVMINDNILINSKFFEAIAEYTKASAQNISTWLDKSALIFAIVFVVICIWDSIMAFVNSKR